MQDELQNNPEGIADGPGTNLGLLRSIELPVTIRFGSTKLTLRALSLLRTGTAVTLDNAVTDLIEVVAGGNVIARGEPVIVEGKYGIRITEIASQNDRLAAAPMNATAGVTE